MNTRKMAMLIFLGLAFAGCNRHDPPPANVAEIGTRMTALMKQHRFNEAAQLGVDASAGKPDAMTYYWVALAYAEKAHYEPDTKDESLKLVSEYARKSSALEPNSRVIGFNVTWVLEYAGDIDSSSRCKFYADSLEEYDEMSSKVSGDSVLENQVAASTSASLKKPRPRIAGDLPFVTMRLDSAMTQAPTVAHDNNGNTLSDPSDKAYTWDFENRLSSVGVPSTATVGPQVRSIRQTHPEIRAAGYHQLPL